MSNTLDYNRFEITLVGTATETHKSSRWGDACDFSSQEWQTKKFSKVSIYDKHMNRTWYYKNGSSALHCTDL